MTQKRPASSRDQWFLTHYEIPPSKNRLRTLSTGENTNGISKCMRKKDHVFWNHMISFWILLFFFSSSLCSKTALSQETGLVNPGDAGYGQPLTEEQALYLLENGRGDELTSEDIAEYIDRIDDITELNSYELNTYIQATYGSELNIESAAAGAQITSDGEIVNGEGGSRINLKDIPEESSVFLEADGSIAIYPVNGKKDRIDYEMLYNENTNNGKEKRPPITITSVDEDYVFADGTTLQDGATLALIDKGLYQLDGTMEYNGVKIASKDIPIAVLDMEKAGSEYGRITRESQTISSKGGIFLDSQSIILYGDAEAMITQNNGYNAREGQALLFSTEKNGKIAYDTSKNPPVLDMYGEAAVFNGFRLLKGTENGEFYSLRGGTEWMDKSPSIQNKGEIISKFYNEKLYGEYGYFPTSSVDMDINYYAGSNGEKQTWQQTEQYQLRTENFESLKSSDAYVASYFMDEPYQKTLKNPEKKAVILWTYGADEKERDMFMKTVEQKKQALLATGYTKDQIEVKYYDDDIDAFAILNAQEDLTYLDVVGHGWVNPEEGGKIGTHKYYTEGYAETYAITSTKIHDYFQLRNQGKTSDEILAHFKEDHDKELGEIGLAPEKLPPSAKEAAAKTGGNALGTLFSEEGAVCTISTCHSAAQYSYYDAHEGVVPVQAGEQPLSALQQPTAQAIKQEAGPKTTVYGTVGPMYYAKDEHGVSTLVPVLDTAAIMEGTYQPSAETIYNQDVPYYEVSNTGLIVQ